MANPLTAPRSKGVRKNAPRAGVGRMGGKTVKFKIEKFDEMEGPVWVTVTTLPPKGSFSETVFDGWVHSEDFNVTLTGRQRMPVIVTARRVPKAIADVPKTKETGRPQLADDPNTWTEENYYCGDQDCQEKGFCRHEDLTEGRYICPRSIMCPSGIVRRADELIIIREAGPPVPMSKLAQAQRDEAAKEEEINARLEAERNFFRDKPMPQHKEVTPPPMNLPSEHGGSGPSQPLSPMAQAILKGNQ